MEQWSVAKSSGLQLKKRKFMFQKSNNEVKKTNQSKLKKLSERQDWALVVLGKEFLKAGDDNKLA